jgi:hypothetical protein
MSPDEKTALVVLLQAADYVIDGLRGIPGFHLRGGGKLQSDIAEAIATLSAGGDDAE